MNSYLDEAIASKLSLFARLRALNKTYFCKIISVVFKITSKSRRRKQMPHLPPQTWSSSRISLLICAGVTYSFPSSVCTTSNCFSAISLVTISIQFRSDNLSTAYRIISYSKQVLAKMIFKLMFQNNKHRKYNENYLLFCVNTFSNKKNNFRILLFS